jgi:predicted permease
MSIWSKLRSLALKHKLDAEMAEEMRHHVELQTELNIKAGMSPHEARYAALRKFGNVASIQEQARARRSGVWMEHLLRDILYAGRMLRRNTAFTTAAVASLVLCVGATTGIFAMLYALVLKPLPFHGSSQIVEIYNAFPKVGIDKLASNLAQYFDYKKNATALAQVGLWRLDDYIVDGNEISLRVAGAIATPEMFSLLEVEPALGRFFTEENHLPGKDKVVVLMQSFWSAHFHDDPQVIGRTMHIDGEPFEIIGVAPAVLGTFDPQARFVRPLSWKEGDNFSRLGYSPALYARLNHGISLAETSAQAVALEKRFYDQAPQGTRDFLDRTGHLIRVDTVQSQRAAPVKTSLYLLQCGALFVLLIGCVNVANLSLARSNARRGEFAVRMALGAGRASIVRQLLVESALLAFLGTAGGVLVAASSLGAMNHFAAYYQPDSLPFGLDVPVLAFATAIAAGLTLSIGALPVLRIFNDGISHPLRGEGRGMSSSHGARTAAGSLVVAQTAFAFVLLMGAGLLLRSFANMLAAEPGFDPHQVINARIAVPADKEKKLPPRLEEALGEIPGVEVALASSTPFVFVPHYQVSMPLDSVGLRDYAVSSGAPQPSAYHSGVSLTYLKTMRIPLRAGRWFKEEDKVRRHAVVVDESFARRYFPGGSAVGRRIVLNGGAPKKDDDWLEIVGVVGNVRHNGLEDKSGLPFVYEPLSQVPLYGTMSVFIRTDRPASEVANLLRNKVAAIDPTLPIVQIAPMAQVIGDSLERHRGIAQLIAAFGGIALLLSAVGIYGVLAYDVSRRTREIGVRSAIGATRGQIAWMVIRQGMQKTILGLFLGVIVTALLGRFISSLLFEIQPTDPLIYIAVSLGLVLVAFVACWLPARRAARVDPMVVLRTE